MSSNKLELNIEVDVAALKEGFATGLKLAQKFVTQFNGLMSGERTQVDIKDVPRTSGDEPEWSSSPQFQQLCSPHKRG